MPKSMVWTLAVYIGMMSGLGFGFGVLALLQYVMGVALEEQFFFLVIYLATCVWIYFLGYISGRTTQRGYWKELLFASVVFVISVQWVPFEIPIKEWGLVLQETGNSVIIVLFRASLVLLYLMASSLLFVGAVTGKLRSLRIARMDCERTLDA